MTTGPENTDAAVGAGETIRVILFKDDGTWVAQGLERDICVQADKLGELYGRFEVAVRLESAERGGLERIGKAPQFFFDLWDRKDGRYEPEKPVTGNFEFGLAA